MIHVIHFKFKVHPLTCHEAPKGREKYSFIALNGFGGHRHAPAALPPVKKDPVGGEIFRTRPDQLWGPTSLLYTGYRVFLPEVTRLERGIDHPPHLAQKLKKEWSYISTPL